MTNFVILGTKVGAVSKLETSTNPQAQLTRFQECCDRVQIWVQGKPETVRYSSIRFVGDTCHTVQIDTLSEEANLVKF